MSPADALVELASPLDRVAEAGPVLMGAPTDAWTDGDMAPAAALLRAAYPQDLGSLFATRGTAAEWRAYVALLVTLGPCGVFQREWSRVIRDGGGLLGVALMTWMAPRTAHLAQLAVRPDAQRRGLARRLVQESAAAARAAGCRELTLLVARRNEPARRLYESLGFTPVCA